MLFELSLDVVCYLGSELNACKYSQDIHESSVFVPEVTSNNISLARRLSAKVPCPCCLSYNLTTLKTMCCFSL